jgi:hypothetical protein
MKTLIKKLLFGIDHSQEYICAGAGGVENVLNSYVLAGDKKISVGKNLLFLGYSPLIMSLETDEEISNRDITFFLENKGRILAKIVLEIQGKIPLEGKLLFLLKGKSAEQKFESSFHQFMFRWYERFRPKHSFNVDLDSRLYTQVKIAYSLPREIKLITLGKENKWNIFPTDLHGYSGKEHYIISLRHDKKACAQAEENGKLALWSISKNYSQQAYALGKNHSQELSSSSTEFFTGNKSPVFHLPEPKGAFTCLELELENVIDDYGIHRLLLFKIVSRNKDENPERLVHLHRSYVQWHLRNGFGFEEEKR